MWIWCSAPMPCGSSRSFCGGSMRPGKRVFAVDDEDGTIAEGIPVVREKGVKAWVSIMYGCNNFCSYCIVPYVRGRERSRDPQCVVAGGPGAGGSRVQGHHPPGPERQLLRQRPGTGLRLCRICWRTSTRSPASTCIRFMSSHPKDATNKLFDVMAKCPHVAKQLHLPFQSGNDRVLKEMNRRYTREKYLELRFATPEA